ncbi:hypothetical protein B0I35DRAFT_193805 [Stachybotrys elegans]|uniref:Zn(2)-C6 fungal-type domain-containing protein n=1 Tax=Stachybotrys elegans TaxID=80388 RepID=A0A8K0T0P5_9HYPO|nr:hypothetical protein B0I35DRAFT_193805 [Stachybotrys elegans]
MTSPVQPLRATRSSLACLHCRSRHLRCDGQKPRCSRCRDASQPCQYAVSRRGGLDRAALAERRRRLASGAGSNSRISTAPSYSSSSTSPTNVSMPIILRNDVANPDVAGALPSPSSSSPSPSHDIAKDDLFNSYYENFHHFHPFLLPRHRLLRLYRTPPRSPSLDALVAVMRFIGHIYAKKSWSFPLQAAIVDTLSHCTQPDPIIIQCRLLYSIPLFWHCYSSDAKREIEAAARLARDLGMFRREFAVVHGSGDPIQEECWRRTWWTLYIIDAYYAGTTGTLNFAVQDIQVTTDLPCEEHEYESGIIPTPKTLDDFDSREFADESLTFSSFAYLIGAIRCAALAISISPKITRKEASEEVIQQADAVIDGWSLLLPKGSKEVMDKNGQIDELMFQAHLIILVASVGLHRPLSDLKFNALEGISSCAREPPLDTPTPGLVNVHTTRVLRAARAQIRLLALPAHPFHHTPFTTCMVSEGTLALLSACSFHFKGKELAVTRDQIRMTIGCLKALGEIWTRTARNVTELQTIARHVLCIKGNTQVAQAIPSSVVSGNQSENDSVDLGDIFPGVQDYVNLCGWLGSDDSGSDLSWLMNGEGLQGEQLSV